MRFKTSPSCFLRELLIIQTYAPSGVWFSLWVYGIFVDLCFWALPRRYHYPVPKIFYVQLSVGIHEFIGEGRTRQAARHNAAMKALQALRNEPIPERPPQVTTVQPMHTDTQTHVLFIGPLRMLLLPSWLYSTWLLSLWLFLQSTPSYLISLPVRMKDLHWSVGALHRSTLLSVSPCFSAARSMNA